MAKFIIIFLVVIGSSLSYITYKGIGQDEIVYNSSDARHGSYHFGSSSGSYGSGGYGYGK